MPDFSYRHNIEEIMDQPGHEFDEIKAALKELDRVNSWLGGYNHVWNGLKNLGILEQKEVQIADWACGGGEMLRYIARKGRKKGINMHLSGIDVNPVILEYAGKICSEYPEIKLLQADLFKDPLPEKQDYVICNLFCHHTSDEEMINLLKHMKNIATKGIVINDLHRHPLAYYSIKFLTKLMSSSPMVNFDGPVSVLRGFHRNELENLLIAAGIKDYEISWKWAFRYLVESRTDQ
jgi:ubiquinone/menaquinone biosynthesis C-methylase UbiE